MALSAAFRPRIAARIEGIVFASAFSSPGQVVVPMAFKPENAEIANESSLPDTSVLMRSMTLTITPETLLRTPGLTISKRLVNTSRAPIWIFRFLQ